jgi:hypothetical protein
MLTGKQYVSHHDAISTRAFSQSKSNISFSLEQTSYLFGQRVAGISFWHLLSPLILSDLISGQEMQSHGLFFC